MKRLVLAMLAAAVAATTAASFAQTYPAKPVKLIVPFPPGGNTDVVGRLLAQKLSDGFGQQVYVENRAGAGGTVGAEAAAKSPADGYTLFFGTTGTLASAPALQPNLRYDPVKGFAPISMLVNAPVVFIVASPLPAQSLRELVELARSKPGELKYGSAGTGHFLHIAGEMFKSAARVDLLHVPYKGVAAAQLDLVGGRIDLMIDTIASYEPQLQAGKLRALAVAHPTRLARLPNVPTTAEAGMPGYELAAWFGLVAPAGTPGDIVQRVNAEVVKAWSTRDVVDAMTRMGIEPVSSSPERFAALIVEEGARWRRVIREAGIKIE